MTSLKNKSIILAFGLILLIPGCTAKTSQPFAEPIGISPMQVFWNAIYGTDLSPQERAQRRNDENVWREEIVTQCMHDSGFTYLFTPPIETPVNRSGDWAPDSVEWVSQYGYGQVRRPPGWIHSALMFLQIQTWNTLITSLMLNGEHSQKHLGVARAKRGASSMKPTQAAFVLLTISRHYGKHGTRLRLSYLTFLTSTGIGLIAWLAPVLQNLNSKLMQNYLLLTRDRASGINSEIGIGYQKGSHLPTITRPGLNCTNRRLL